MSANVDAIVKAYRSLARIPALLGAKLTNNQAVVQSIWSQRNPERDETTKFSRTIGLQADLTKLYETFPVDVSTELLSCTSPSGKLKGVLRSAKDKQYLEIWQSESLSKVVDLNALDLHGDVYTDGEFHTWEFSPDETKLMYVAELKIAKSEPFYKRSSKKGNADGDKASATRGEEHLYRQDWGEQLVGKKKSVIAEYRIEKDEVEILAGVPDDLCPAQVIYAPDGGYVVGIAYNTEPRKLGLIYCSNRPSTIFKLDFSGNYTALQLDNKSVKAPIFSPDGKSLLWLQRDAEGPHAAAMALVKSSLPLIEKPQITTVVDIVHNSVPTGNGTNFYGLYNAGFTRRCFASDNRLVLSTNQRNTINAYVIDIDSGAVTELVNPDGNLVILDVIDDTILANKRNFLRPDQLVVAKLPPKESEVNLAWTPLTESETVEGLENLQYVYLDLTHDTNDTVKIFSAIYVGPKTGALKSVPLIVCPHGGPHAAYANNLALETALLLSQGFALLYINYRGSIGAGQDSVDFLLGKIGQSDVADCILATDTALAKFPWLNPDKIALSGGSHGGFLVTYLSGKYPDKYKAVVSRNPVIDVASMSVISDIPDWCYVEVGYSYSQVGAPSEEALVAMRRASPIEWAHQVKAPTLLQIGSKDLRVPMHQGIEYYHRLKANGTTVKLNLYEDNHPLGQVPNEMDHIINSLLWIQQYLDAQ